MEKGGSMGETESTSTLSALDDLESDVNMPEGCDAQLWSRLCQSRSVGDAFIRGGKSILFKNEITKTPRCAVSDATMYFQADESGERGSGETKRRDVGGNDALPAT